MLRSYLCCLILLCLFLQGMGQRSNVDSLYSVLKTEKDDTNKVNTLLALSNEIEISGGFDSALVVAHTGGQLSDKLGYKKGTASSDMVISLLYYYLGNYPKGLEYGFKCLNIYQDMSNKKGVANAYNLVGIIYSAMNNNIKAAEYYNKSLQINEEVGNKNGIANNYGNLGSIYKDQKDYAKALECFQKSFDLHKEVDNRTGMSNNVGNMGAVYEAEENYAKAIEYDSEALKIARDNGIRKNVEANQAALGDIYTKIKQYKEARAYLDSSLVLARSIKVNSDIEAIYYYLFSLDSATGKYQEGLRNYQLYIGYRDSLNNEASTKTQMSLEFEQKQAVEKAEQEKKDAIAGQEQKRQATLRNALIGGFILVLIVVILLYLRYRTKEKTANVLEEQNRIISERNAELERLSIVARETDNLVLIMDAEGRIEWANESFERVNGITVEELKKLKGETIFEISNNPEIRKIIDKAVKEKRPMVYESLNRNKDGAKLWESSTLTPIFDANTGKLNKLVIVDTDITQRKQDEETIHQKNKDITDSIHYAKRLQDAILPPISEIKKVFPDSFVLYKPKDIVAGDFYWMEMSRPQPLLNPPHQGGLTKDDENETAYFTSDPSLYKSLKERAELFRNRPTEAESIAWNLLRANNIGFHIRRQHIIGQYIVDFINFKTKTVIEIDGDIHDYQKDEDEQRTRWLTGRGYYVMRYRNEEVTGNPDGFIKSVTENLKEREQKVSPNGGDLEGAEADTVLLAACDCTGHGVPGAMVSVVCSNALNRALNEYQIREAGSLLDKTRELVLETFEKSEGEVKDGMDISFCALNLQTNRLEWSGANNPLWYIHNGQLTELTADKQPIGKQDNAKPFTTHVINVQKGDILYLLTDGFADQFGGPKGKKFKQVQLMNTLLAMVDKSMNEQLKKLDSIFEQWKGQLEQVDDVLIIGIRI